MNYLEHYLNFYKGENKKALYTMAHNLACAIRNDDEKTICSMLCDDCIADISMIGKGITGKSNICKSLLFPVKDTNLRKVTLSNVVTRSKGDIAQQFLQVQCIFGYEEEEAVFPFVFGGCVAISYRKTNSIWNISNIKFDLVYEAGNNALVADKWMLMDYSLFSGHKPMINMLYDSPWRMISIDEEEMNDTEEVYTQLCRANLATDCGDWEEYRDCLSSDFTMDMSARANANKSNSTTTDTLMSSVRDNIDWIRGKFHKEPRLQHVTCLLDVHFNEDHTEAILYDFRSEFNRLYNDMYCKDNIHTIAYTAIHKNLMVKEHNGWKLKASTFIPHQEFTYVDDDCIQFDEFICGGKTWEQIHAL